MRGINTYPGTAGVRPVYLPRGSGAVDPLAGIPLSRRWQPHNFQNNPSPPAVVRVAGAGSPDVDADYMVITSGAWFAPSAFSGAGANISWQGAFWQILDNNPVSQQPYYQSVDGDISSPATVTIWVSVTLGADPPPTVVGIAASFYLPFGLFQDAACTVPSTAWGDPNGGFKDLFTAGNPTATQSNAMDRSVLQYAKNGSGTWVPFPVFDGVDDFFDLGAFTQAAPWAIYFAAKITGQASGTDPCIIHWGNNGVALFMNTFEALIGDSCTKSGPSISNTAYLSVAVEQPTSNASDAKIYINGIDVTQAATDSGFGMTASQIFKGFQQDVVGGNLIALQVATRVNASDRSTINTYNQSLCPA